MLPDSPYRMRQATSSDYPQIAHIYSRARTLMASHNNPNQWGTTYPSEDVIRDDIAHNRLYVLVHKDETCDCDDHILAQFALCQGADPDYEDLNGAWLDDDDYVTIHRIASSGIVRHAARECLDWAIRHYGNVRLDTHPDNKTMQHVAESAGFARCGIIEINAHTVADSSLDRTRIAYQRHAW